MPIALSQGTPFIAGKGPENGKDSLERLRDEIISCRKCERLVNFREKIAREKTKRFVEQEYWGRPVPGFGSSDARLVVIGLAPAAHGGNRTGRVFTGDLSAKFLMKELYDAGFANQPNSDNIGDGLELRDCYILAAVRCVPPDNIPTREEMQNCFPFLQRELDLLKSARAILLLGKIAFDSYVRYLKYYGIGMPAKMVFRHSNIYDLDDGRRVFASFHPSPRNTNTGNLTPDMFKKLLNSIREFIENG
jgi:uracil-DNA glycosylase family 4